MTALVALLHTELLQRARVLNEVLLGRLRGFRQGLRHAVPFAYA